LRIHDGELWIAGSSLASGYLDDARLTAERFVLAEGRRWFRTHDAGKLFGGRLTVTGRIDNVFVSGGVKVSLDELERFIVTLDGWHEAVVIARDDETWGQRAAVCLVGTLPDTDAMQDAVRSQFGPAWVPTTVHRLTEMPMLASGKPDRAALGTML
jgi:O-succinylbenzoic acid--CoA ligase